MDKQAMKKIGDFRVFCNHSVPPWKCSVILTFQEGSKIKTVLYVKSEPVAEQEVSIRAIAAGVPEIMAKEVTGELVKRYKEEMSMPLLEGVI